MLCPQNLNGHTGANPTSSRSRALTLAHALASTPSLTPTLALANPRLATNHSWCTRATAAPSSSHGCQRQLKLMLIVPLFGMG